MCFQSRMPDGYFSFKELDRRRIGIYLERSLQDLVDRSAPITAIQFRLACRGTDGTTNYLPITVSIEDVNDNTPEFINAPYRFNLDELTPPGECHLLTKLKFCPCPTPLTLRKTYPTCN